MNMNVLTLAFSLMSIFFIPISTLATEKRCTDEYPCIVKAVSAKVRYYNQALEESRFIKKKDFNKLLPADGLVTVGRVQVDDLSMLKIVSPDGDDEVLVEETAFQLRPAKKIDCSGIAAAVLGNADDSTSGVSVGLGNPCEA